MDVAVIALHSGDEYQNVYSTARLNFYGSMIPGFPTVVFDGTLTQVGAGGNMYPSYLAKYNSRINVPSSFTIDVEGTSSGMVEYELDITVEKVEAVTGNLKLYVCVTESHIPEFWGGLSEVNYVLRTMAPNQNGTTLDFSGGDIFETTVNFTMNPDWVTDESEVVIFIQNTTTKEILQGIKRSMDEFGTTNNYDVSVLDLIVPGSICHNQMAPKVKIANYGLENLTSVDFCVYINNVASCTLPWSGNLAFGETAVVDFPMIEEFLILADNTISVEAEDPNGQPDQYPSNNIYELSVPEAANVTSPVTLLLKLDDNPEETSWEVKTSGGTVLYEGGSYTTAGQVVLEEFVLSDIDCYSFVIYDAGGDGLTGTGIYKLAYEGSVIFAENNSFGMQDEQQFGIGLTNVENAAASNFSIFPNPAEKEVFVSLTNEFKQAVKITLIDQSGKIVKQIDGVDTFNSQSARIDLEGIQPGIYFIQVNDSEQILSEKLIVR